VLTNVSIPVAELANLKPVHCTVLAGLLAFADRAGRCWPCLRKLVEITGLTLSRVHRAITEMESAGILTRKRRGAGTLYQLAERFAWQTIRPGAVPSSDRPSGPDCSASGTVSSASGTERESRKESEEDSKRDQGSVRRDAPPVAANHSAHPRGSDSSLHKPAAAAAEGPNPFARRQWLKTLNNFIGERLKGQLQWAGWEVVAKALNGDSLDRAEQRRLDDLDRMMKGCGYRAARSC
jgi:hypothetical protein